MKKQLVGVIVGLSILWANNVSAYLGPNDKAGISGKPAENVLKGANCAPSKAKVTMKFNDVSALLEQGGSMFQDRAKSIATYEIPAGSGLRLIFAGALWMGGTDVNGQLKLAALKFRTANDFWPGPLTVTPGSGNYDPRYPVGDNVVRDFGEATVEQETCTAYDKFYLISKAEVIAFNLWWEFTNGLSTTPADEPTAAAFDHINNWPAHGAVGQDFYLAPFYDRGKDGFYNPLEGDYPWYDDILGRDDIECGVDRRISSSL